jgi:hypothetical protein
MLWSSSRWVTAWAGDVERAYNRSEYLEKRRELMNAWAAHAEPLPENVVPFARARS